MAGTKAGGAKAREANLKRYGEDFYKRIGAIGGRNGHGPEYKGGFAANPALARIAGAKGGRISRRGPAKKDADIDEMERILEEESGRV